MDLNQLAAFVRVVDHGSFTKAARALRQPKSRLSRRLAALEKDLGVPLLYRTSRQLSLTEAGRTLYERSRPHIDSLAVAGRDLHDDTDPQGTLRVTTLPDIGAQLFGHLIAELSALHPRLRIELTLVSDFVDLVGEGIDLALRVGRLRDTSLRTRIVGKIAFILVASPAYLRRAPQVEHLSDVSWHPALAFSAVTPKDHWRLVDGKREELIAVRPVCRSNEPRTLHDLAIAGRGIALLPDFLCADALRAGTLARVLGTISTRPLPVQFVWPAHREPSAKVRAFVDLGVKRLKPYFS